MNYLHKYAMFNSVKEMDEAIAEHIRRNQYELNETDRDVLMMLSRYSVKYKGAAHLKIDTIAAAIGKSGRTIQRVLRKLERLNIIERKEFIRKKAGGHGANIYIILPVDVAAEMTGREDADKPMDISDSDTDEPIETINLLSNNNITKSNTYQETSYSMPYRKIRKAIMTFIGNRDNVNKLIYRLYGVFLAHTKPLRFAYSMDELISTGIKAIHATFHATKRKKIRNIAGYFSGVLNNMLDDLYFAKTAEYWAPDKISVEQSLILRSF